MSRRLDVRGLPPCEPFERIIAALDVLPPGETLEVLIHREPVPLHDWLEEHGFAHEGGAAGEADGMPLYRFLIRHA